MFSKKSKNIKFLSVAICASLISAAALTACTETKGSETGSSVVETTSASAQNKTSEASEEASAAESSKFESSKETYAESSRIESTEETSKTGSKSSAASSGAEQESPAVKDYSSYVGDWSKEAPNGNGAGVYLTVQSIKGSDISFILTSVSTNANRIAGTSAIKAKINQRGEVNFSFEDSFANKGIGYLKLNKDSIYVKTNVDETEEWQGFALVADETLERKK